MGHQLKIVAFARDKQYVGVFADYGTGKTLSALAMIEDQKAKCVLVIAPKLAIETTWIDEIKKHTDYRYCVLRGTAGKKRFLLQAGVEKAIGRYATGVPVVFLINYEGVKPIWRELASVGFDMVICDESTKIKTYNTERTKSAIEVGKTAKFRCILTGFPITENLAELYSQVKFLDQGEHFGNSYYAFLNRYFTRMGPKIIIKKKSINRILDIVKPFCIRITNDMLKLPPKIYKQIPIDQTDEQRALLNKLEETFRLEFGKAKVDTQYLFTIIAKSLQICDGFIQYSDTDENGKEINKGTEVIPSNKDEALIEILDEIDVAKNKVVIWAAFLFSVKKIAKIIEKLGHKVLMLTGEAEDTNKVVQLFQKTKDHNVLVCTQKKAAESITLTEARYAIYYSNIWSNDARLNSEARIRRKGSEKHSSIMYIDLVTKGTVEKKVCDCLRMKKDLIDELKKEFGALKVGER
jgi:SNF2 family DNA or RNA helicase